MKISAFEAMTNAVIGLFVSWCVTYFALPFWGLAPTAGASAAITAVYFIISFIRAWIIREVFRRALRVE